MWKSYTVFIKFIPGYFILLDATVSGIILFFVFLKFILTYRNILCPMTLLNSFTNNASNF